MGHNSRIECGIDTDQLFLEKIEIDDQNLLAHAQEVKIEIEKMFIENIDEILV